MSHPRAPWAQGEESGRQVATLGLAVMLTIVALDHLMVGRLSLFFDLSFITLCLGLAVLVSAHDYYMMGLLPPLLMVVVFVLLGVVAPQLIADPQDGVVQSVISGLAHHSTALFVGYAVSLAALEHRRRQTSKREGSPAPPMTASTSC